MFKAISILLFLIIVLESTDFVFCQNSNLLAIQTAKMAEIQKWKDLYPASKGEISKLEALTLAIMKKSLENNSNTAQINKLLAIQVVLIEQFKSDRQQSRPFPFPFPSSLSTQDLLKKFSICISDKEWSSSGMDFLASKTSDKGPCSHCHDWRRPNFITDISKPQPYDPYRAVKTLAQPFVREGQVFFGIGNITKQPSNHPLYSWSSAESEKVENFIEAIRNSAETGKCDLQVDIARAKSMNQKGSVAYAVRNGEKSWNTADTRYLIAPSVQDDGWIDPSKPFLVYFCNFTPSPISIHSSSSGPINHGQSIPPAQINFSNVQEAQDYLDRMPPAEYSQLPYCRSHLVRANKYKDGDTYNHATHDRTDLIYFKLMLVYPDGSVRTP